MDEDLCLELLPEARPRFDLGGFQNMMDVVRVVCACVQLRPSNRPTRYTSTSLDDARKSVLSIGFLIDVMAAEPDLIRRDPRVYMYYFMVKELLSVSPRTGMCYMQMFLEAYALLARGESVLSMFEGENMRRWFLLAGGVARDRDKWLVVEMSQRVNHA